MVNAPIFPFPTAGGVNAPRRSMSPPAANGDGFAGAMDDALDPPRTLRGDDSAARAPRRAEPARARGTSESKAAAPSRTSANSQKAVSAKKADRAEEPDQKTAPDRDDEPCTDDSTAADSPAQPAAAAKTDAAQGDTPAEPAKDAATETAAEQASAVATNAADLIAGDDEDAGTPAAGDQMARGRRWEAPVADQAGEQGKTVRNGAARGAGAAASPGLRLGHGAAAVPIEATGTTGVPLAETAHQAAVVAQGDASAGAAAKSGAVTQAIETAASTPQTASAADAATAIENAVAAVESVAVVETSAGGDAGGTETREQAQPKPQSSASQTNISETAAAGGPAEGVRFTLNSATGNAAYANATPRHEEAMLPQIVQSIRLHAVQGTTEARVQLKPEHLGVLNITLKVEQNQVTATIQADVAAVRSWIESHEASLRQALSEQGLHLAKLVVHEDGQQASKDEHDGERPRRQPRRRSWRDEEATFEVLV
ncbi:MAG TPA: flagellar hook-length control protein FliK [Vicinamibacterales bacterium]|nr:flagellar hook-length control protein FliK [Vicinamibacterales bacterium]